MGKILFLDVDGTLVNYENKLPESAIKAIRKARENGHKVYICTGRSKAEVYQELWDIGLDGMIGGNGSYVEDHGQVVLHQLITKEQSKKIVDWLLSRGLEFYLESNSGLYASKNFETRGESTIKEYIKRKGRDDADKITVRDVFPEMIFGGDLYRDDLNKVSYILNSYQDYLDTKAEFPDLQSGTWGGKGEDVLFGDLGVKDISKAYAIEQLLSYIGADIEDTIAFGDAEVDIPMFEYCKYGVAMGNGRAKIKEIADYITDDVDNDGLYNAFVKLNLI
jgi:Cof subfamily protein (haloacid dehalogenase superfamily)